MTRHAIPAVRIDANFAGERAWRDDLRAHLLRLKPDARVNRFFGAASDAAIARYAAEANPALLVGAVDKGAVVGMAEVHVHQADAGVEGEIAISVDDDHRHAGLGGALFHRAVTEARRLGLDDIRVSYLRSNTAMQHLAEHEGFEPLPGHDAAVAEAHLVGRGQSRVS